MKIYIGVENFGKIRSAYVDVSNYTLFVGENNSGKTYLMQLIYHVFTKLRITEESVDEFGGFIEKLKMNGEAQMLLEDYDVLQRDINKFLEKNKDNIVKDIFQRDINIGRLFIEFKPEEIDEISVKYELIGEDEQDFRLSKVVAELRGAFSEDLKLRKITIANKSVMSDGGMDSVYSLFREVSNTEIVNQIIGFILNDRNGIFIPASRTGLLMLYRNFFAETADAMRDGKNLSNEMGLTAPVYNFLRFLQTINYDENNNALIRFAEENIIDGHLIMKKDEPIRYVDINDKTIPLILSSSMINEMTPIIQCIASTRHIRFMIIDEIETSLHPKKQKEMARFLNRINNAGYKLIISTHSDTMASYINNLHILSRKRISSEEMKKYGLKEDDLLKRGDIHYYEFKNMEDGTSTVNELEFGQYPNDGVSFPLFYESANELYDLSLQVLDIKE